jgi:hypothetical protein
MRTLITAAFVLISFAFLMFPVPPSALAQEACPCKGCGCKGGPGWRGPEGTCVSQAKLAEICGSPAGVPCTQEGASRVCFGKQSAIADPEVRNTP